MTVLKKLHENTRKYGLKHQICLLECWTLVRKGKDIDLRLGVSLQGSRILNRNSTYSG